MTRTLRACEAPGHATLERNVRSGRQRGRLHPPRRLDRALLLVWSGRLPLVRPFRLVPAHVARLPALAARQGSGESVGLVAQRDLARYYALLARELAGLHLSEPEASLIVDALNGAYLDEHTLHLVRASIADALHADRLADKWDVDGKAFLGKLATWTPAQCFALADAAEYYWRAGGEHAERLWSVGLVPK